MICLGACPIWCYDAIAKSMSMFSVLPSMVNFNNTIQIEKSNVPKKVETHRVVILIWEGPTGHSNKER